jgi:hypothetical protein
MFVVTGSISYSAGICLADLMSIKDVSIPGSDQINCFYDTLALLIRRTANVYESVRELLMLQSDCDVTRPLGSTPRSVKLP